MLLNLREYHRPGEDAQPGRQRERLDQALALLARPHLRTVALAGGGALLGSSDPSIDAVVDLQGLGLDEIAVDGPDSSNAQTPFGSKPAERAGSTRGSPSGGIVAGHSGQGGKARLRIGAMATRVALAGALPARAGWGRAGGGRVALARQRAARPCHCRRCGRGGRGHRPSGGSVAGL